MKKVILWKKCRKKPIVVEFREAHEDGEHLTNDLDGREYFVNPETHFIIRGIKGELYSIDKEVFHETYERI